VALLLSILCISIFIAKNTKTEIYPKTQFFFDYLLFSNKNELVIFYQTNKQRKTNSGLYYSLEFMKITT